MLKGSAAAIAASAGSVLLGGCGSGNDAASGTSFTFLPVLPLTTLTFAPELLADAGGYFADQGLDVSFQSTRGSAQAIQLVLAEGAPLTRIGQIEAVNHASNRGAPIVNVATVVKESTIRFVSSADAAIREPRDFIDKMIGIPSEGGESETTIDLILASANIDPARVERQVVGVGPGVFNLVEQGRIAGFLVSIDTARILEQQSPNAVVLNPGNFIESGAQVYMTSETQFAADPEPIRRYLAAVGAAIDFMIADDGFDATLEIMRRKYSFGTLQNDAVAKASLADYVRAWTLEGMDNVMRTDPARWQAGYDELVRVGQAQPGLDPSSWYTNELAPPR